MDEGADGVYLFASTRVMDTEAERELNATMRAAADAGRLMNSLKYTAGGLLLAALLACLCAVYAQTLLALALPAGGGSTGSRQALHIKYLHLALLSSKIAQNKPASHPADLHPCWLACAVQV